MITHLRYIAEQMNNGNYVDPKEGRNGKYARSFYYLSPEGRVEDANWKAQDNPEQHRPDQELVAQAIGGSVPEDEGWHFDDSQSKQNPLLEEDTQGTPLQIGSSK